MEDPASTAKPADNPPALGHPRPPEVVELAHALIHTRQTILPKRLAEVFATALVERDASATPQQVAQAREKAYRSPLLLLAVVRLRDDDAEIEPHERIVSAGCALQNVLLMAHALGFGGALTSGKALASAPLRRLFDLHDDEQALCFVNIGTVAKPKRARARPQAAQYVSVLQP